MKLIHYTDKEFVLEPRPYHQAELPWQAKPNGLWVSVKGKDDWKSWCEAEDYILENLAISYEVKLKKDADILHLKTPEDIYKLSLFFPYLRKQWDNPEGRELCQCYELDWIKVKEQYQGIIIAPYQWDCRLSSKCNWYYGWDCASGCIWDISCIKEFKLKEINECHRSNSCVG